MFGNDGGAGLLSWQLAMYRSHDARRRRREDDEMYALNLQWQQAYDQVVQQRDQYRAGRNEAVNAHNALLDRHEALIATHRELKAAHQALAAEKDRVEQQRAASEDDWTRCNETAGGLLIGIRELEVEKAALLAENERLRNRLRTLEGGTNL